MGTQFGQLPTDFPIPGEGEQQPVQVRPARPPEPLPASSGFGGKTATGLAVASNFLEGWIQGKQIKEERLRRQAMDDLSARRQLFAMSYKAYQDFIGQPPPTDPGERQKWEAQKASLGQSVVLAKNQYGEGMQRYMAPEQQKQTGLKGKLRSVGEGAKKAMTAQPPHLFSQAAYQMFQSMSPDVLLQPSQETRRGEAQIEESQAQKEAAQAQTKAEETRNQVEKAQLEYTKKTDAARTEYADLLSKNQFLTPDEASRLRKDRVLLDKKESDEGEEKLKVGIMNGTATPSEVEAGKKLGWIPQDQPWFNQTNKGMVITQMVNGKPVTSIVPGPDGKPLYPYKDWGSSEFSYAAEAYAKGQELTHPKATPEEKQQWLGQGYLESFASWQKARNPEFNRKEFTGGLKSSIHDMITDSKTEVSWATAKYGKDSPEYKAVMAIAESYDTGVMPKNADPKMVEKMRPEFESRLRQMMDGKGFGGDVMDKYFNMGVGSQGGGLPPNLKGVAPGPYSMTPGSAGGTDQTPDQTPAPTKRYKITDPDGRSRYRDLTNEDAKAAQQDGRTVEEAPQ